MKSLERERETVAEIFSLLDFHPLFKGEKGKESERRMRGILAIHSPT